MIRTEMPNEYNPIKRKNFNIRAIPITSDSNPFVGALPVLRNVRLSRMGSKMDASGIIGTVDDEAPNYKSADIGAFQDMEVPEIRIIFFRLIRNTSPMGVRNIPYAIRARAFAPSDKLKLKSSIAKGLYRSTHQQNIGR